jgi:DNA-binding beta-propeller fold protein YncE
MRKPLLILIFITLFLSPININAEELPEVTTLAGTGAHGADDGESAQFNMPSGIAGDGSLLFIADTYNNMIREIDGDGVTDTLTGQILAFDEYRLPKGLYQNAITRFALFNRPSGIVADSDGRLFVADTSNNVIRVIQNGRVRTFAGNARAGWRDGNTVNARFNGPVGLAIDGEGNLYVADTLNHCIRKINKDGFVTTIAGRPAVPGIRDGLSNRASFNSPMGIAVSEDGATIYVADTGNHLIRVIKGGRVSTYAGASGLTDQDGDPLGGYLDGESSEALFNLPMGLTLNNGDLIVADSGNHRIRLVTSQEVSTLAGTGEPGAADGLPEESEFNLPSDVFIQNGVLYIADTGNNLIRSLTLLND